MRLLSNAPNYSHNTDSTVKASNLGQNIDIKLRPQELMNLLDKHGRYYRVNKTCNI
jgi:hypothetical protein